MTKNGTEFDFATLDLAVATDKPYEFEIRHPVTDDGLGVFVSVIGADSATFQGYMRERVNRARQEALRRKGKEEVVTVEQEETEILTAVASCMTGWRTVKDGKSEPHIVIAGEQLAFSHANALRWLRQFKWVRQQVNDATADLSNFIGA